MKFACGVTIEDLFIYREDRLRGARGEYIEAHVRHCEICQEQLAMLDETAMILAPAAATTDNPTSRDRLIREIQQRESDPRAQSWLHFDRFWPRLLVPGALIVMFLILVWPTASQADMGIAGAVRDMSPGMARSLPEEEEPPGTPLRDRELSPFITSIELPDGYTLYHAEGEGHKSLDLWFKNEEGREILLTQTSLDADFEVHSSSAQSEYVGNAQVLFVPGSYEGYLGDLHWEREGIRFHLHPTVPTSIRKDIAFDIIQEVIEIQDAPSE